MFIKKEEEKKICWRVNLLSYHDRPGAWFFCFYVRCLIMMYVSELQRQDDPNCCWLAGPCWRWQILWCHFRWNWWVYILQSIFLSVQTKMLLLHGDLTISKSILSFFFPSSALRYFLRQDMWGKIFDRKCVINFPLWHNSLSVGKHGLLGIIPENQHFTKDDLWNHKNDWSFFKHFTDWFTYDFWRFLKACFCLSPP